SPFYCLDFEHSGYARLGPHRASCLASSFLYLFWNQCARVQRLQSCVVCWNITRYFIWFFIRLTFPRFISGCVYCLQTTPSVASSTHLATNHLGIWVYFRL